MISMVWEMPSETSYRQYMWLDGTHYSLIRKLTRLGLKSPQNLPLEHLLLTIITRKRFQNQSLFLSTERRPFLLYWLSLRRKSTSSPNISNPRSPQSRTMLKISMSKLENHTPRPPKLQSIPLKF